MTRRSLLLCLVLGLLSPVIPSAGAAPEGLDARRAEAARIQSELERRGERLSIADEDYNQARLERQRLEAKLDGARSDLAAAEQRWTALKEQLGARVRVLYMHPGAWAETLLGARTLGQLARGRALAGSVLMSDTELLFETEQARREISQIAAGLADLRSVARQKEDEQAAKRSVVEREIRAQRALLSEVKGEIATLLEAERRRELEAARLASEEAARAAAARAQAAPTPSGASAPQAPAVQTPDDAPPRAVRASAGKAVETARQQLGKPYEWGAAGPNSYDCSGLTMYAWNAAGVQLPHSSRAQYASLPKVSRSQIQPGDLLFFGNPIHHVGIYEGNGVMINAPQTGETVRRSSIDRSDYVGAGRP